MTTSGTFTEIADRVWVSRRAWLDLNVVLVAGTDGLLVVDPTGSEAAAREVRNEVRGLTAAPVVAVVNTHEHFDHTFGNAVFRDERAEVRLIATEVAAAETSSAGERTKREYAAADGDPHAADVIASRVLPADETFSAAYGLDLGDRFVELVHPGRGHTGGDLVLRIPDADVLVAGDLLEESAPPAYGPDSFPLDWPGSLDLVMGLLTPSSVVVPGHGALVDQDFVDSQLRDVNQVAETIRDLVLRGVPADRALEAADWPFPRDVLQHAVRRGYDHVPRTARRLPLV